MDKHIKNNLLITIIVLMLGMTFTFFTKLSYIETRFLGTLFAVLELFIVILIARKQNMTLKDIGLCKPHKPIAWVIGIIFSLLPITLMIILNGGNMNTMFPSKTSLYICIIQTLYYFIVVAPSEEIIFRGFILENFNKKYSENISIIFTSLLFSSVHIFNGSIINLIMTFIISVIYCKVKLLKSNKSLFPCMLGHAINDSLNQWIPYFMF
ncbi:MAG: type II CAAX endopeptidase family protein [Coprobacillus sp.]